MRETAAVEGERQAVRQHGFRTAGGKDMHVVRQGQAAADGGRGIVVAGNRVDGNAGSLQTRHLAHEKQAGGVILPVAIEHIAGEQHEIHPLGECQCHQILERHPRRPAQGSNRRAVIGIQPDQGAVDVAVGGVEEAEHEQA